MSGTEGTRSVLRTQQFPYERIKKISAVADRVLEIQETAEGARFLKGLLPNHRAFLIFDEPSTRTRMSFQQASIALGMDTFVSDSDQLSSAIKGESVEDMLQVLASFKPSPHVIVHRHKDITTPLRAEAKLRQYGIPYVNAGNGRDQHPTQSLVDIHTIFKKLGRLTNFTIVIGGDLKRGRTARSLAYMLTRFSGIRIIFVAHPALQIGEDIQQHLREHEVPFDLVLDTDFRDALWVADVVYWTRMQLERVEGEPAVPDMVITAKEMALMRPHTILMHPLPRTTEILSEVDEDPRAVYFEQAGFGPSVRSALFAEMFGVDQDILNAENIWRRRS